MAAFYSAYHECYTISRANAPHGSCKHTPPFCTLCSFYDTGIVFEPHVPFPQFFYLLRGPSMKFQMSLSERYGKSSTCAPPAGACALSSSTSCARPWVNQWASSRTKKPTIDFSLRSTPTRWEVSLSAFTFYTEFRKAHQPSPGCPMFRAPWDELWLPVFLQHERAQTEERHC